MRETILINGDAREVEDMIRLTFHDYWDLLALAQSSLGQTSLVKACLLERDEPKGATLGMAVRVVLDWGLAQLGATGKERDQISYEVLEKRYIEGLSNSRYADLMFIADDTAHARRKAAISKLTKILQQEEQAPVEADKRKEALIGLRYEACDEKEQRLLRLLAIFPTKVPLQLLNNIENEVIEHNYWALISQNLIIMTQASLEQANQASLKLHTELRPYIMTLLTVDEQQRWHLMASCYYQQEGKLMEAVYHLQQAGEYEQAAALLVEQAHELDADLPLEPLYRCLATFERHTLSANRWAEVKILAGRIAEMSNDVEMALWQYEQALGVENQAIRAQAYYRLASLYEQRDIKTAFIHYATSQRLSEHLETIQSIELLANVHIRVAWLLVQHAPDKNEAQANLQQAKSLLDRQSLLLRGKVKRKWHRLRSDLYTTWATVLAHQEESNSQMEHRHRWLAWQEAREAQDVEQMINTAYNLGTMYFWQADYTEAQSYFEQSQTLAIEAGNERMVALNDKGIGGCYFSGAADYEKAVKYYQKAYHYLKETGNQYWQATASYDLAEAYLLLGDGITAKQYFNEGLAIANTSGYKRLQAEFEALTQRYIELSFDLSHKQQHRLLQAIIFIRQNGEITNQQYKELTNCAHKTAAGDLGELVTQGICVRVGKGRGTRYKLVSS